MHKRLPSVCHRRNLTPPSSGRPKAGFAHFVPPLMSNVRPHNVVAASLSRSQAPAKAAACERATSSVPRQPLGKPLRHLSKPRDPEAGNRGAARLGPGTNAISHQTPKSRGGLPASVLKGAEAQGVFDAPTTEVGAVRSNPPVNADARDVPAPASDRAARAGYRAR
jgi:hypothetical protein